MRKGRKWYNNRLVPWILPVVTIILWQLLVQYKIVTTTLLPSPLEVVEAAIKLSKSGELQEHVYISTQRALIGFAIGGIIGFILGLVNGTVVFLKEQ